MVFVPGGTFQLGKALGTVSATYNPDVTPVSNVTLSSFYMGKYEVTQAQWHAVMGGATIEQRHQTWYPTSNFGMGDAYPMYFISWYEAVEFCNALSVLEGLTPFYTINKEQADPNNMNDSDRIKWLVTPNTGATGYRLPTEAQWEYAAKGGNPLAPGWIGYAYAGSDNADDVAWCYENSGNRSHEVGTKAPNRLGLYDMSGNVWELCWDWHDDYTSADKTNPTGPSSGYDRVIRGGGFIEERSPWNPNSAQGVRSLTRCGNNLQLSSALNMNDGFRLVLPGN